MADETVSIQQAEQVDHQLVRGIGTPALTANIVSSTIGAGIFVIPATVAAGLGPTAPLAFICCVLANSIALVIPFLGGPVMRIVVMLAVYGVLVFINIRGVREGAGAVTTITIAKLLPLLLFIGVGIFFINPQNLSWPGWPGSKPLGDAVVLLMFAFVGIEVA